MHYELSATAVNGVVVGGIVFGFIAIGVVILFLVLMFVARARLRRAEQFEGPAVTGTAQLLSADRAGGLAGLAVDSVVGNRGVMSAARIGLRVQIPGRPPYDVTVTTRVRNTWLYKARRWPSGTYVVQVDSANPERVRFNDLQTWPPRGWYPDPSGAQAQRYWDGCQWTESRPSPRD